MKKIIASTGLTMAMAVLEPGVFTTLLHVAAASWS